MESAMATDPVWQGEMGRSWARMQEATDRQFAEVGRAVVGLLDAKAGERILDLGCGAGSTTLAIAEAVGPSGRVTGVDISPDLVALAQQRTRTLASVTIVEADAARHGFEPASHDALFSRHGCMFFADATAAFANIRRGLKPRARVAMSAFAPLAENPWATVPLSIVESVLGPAPASNSPPPGPFSWANPSVFETALAAAGFGSIAWEARTVAFTLGAGDHPDPVERACDMVLTIGMVARRVISEGKAAEIAVRPALREALAPHVKDGWVRLDAKIWLITAIA
jgi:SAM-dependent methyltransferase